MIVNPLSSVPMLFMYQGISSHAIESFVLEYSSLCIKWQIVTIYYKYFASEQLC